MGENVKILMEELKNISELMLDLAYSSILFENKEIAEEVLLLYEKMEELEEKIYMHLFAASRGRKSERLISVMDVVECAKTVGSAAKQLSESVIQGKKLHSVIKEALKESEESIVKLIVEENSYLSNKKMGDLKIRTNTGVNVIAIKSGDKWIFDPDKNTNILPGDIIIGVGTSEGCEKLKVMAKSSEKI
jgi:uncharacterized protein with PhoU and TrkA domain